MFDFQKLKMYKNAKDFHKSCKKLKNQNFYIPIFNNMKSITLKLIPFIFLFIVYACSNNKKEELIKVATKDTISNEEGRLLPRQLRHIPFGIIVEHNPNPCYPEKEDSNYVWKHNTSVRANNDMRIIEYGSFVYTKKGWYLRVKNDTKFFDEHYGTKNGMLKKDSVYVDPLSFRYSDSVFAGDAMWYYIAEDAEGNKYKGIGPIETEGISLEELNKQKGLKTYSITKSKMDWTGYGEIGSYSLSGTMKLKSGTYQIKDNQLTSTHIIFDMNTIESEQEGLADHLKGADFFETGRYPTCEFVLKSSVAITEKITITGILTIKGISKEINLPLTHRLANGNHIFEGKTSIDRTQFNVKYNSKNFFSNLGDQAIKDKIDLKFEIITTEI